LGKNVFLFTKTVFMHSFMQEKIYVFNNPNCIKIKNNVELSQFFIFFIL